MIPLPLKLERRIDQSSRDVIVAGWISSSNPTDWLREAAQWRATGQTKDIRIIPVILSGVNCGAVLLLPDGVEGRLGDRVEPLIRVASNVLSLRSAQLNVSVLEKESRYFLFSEFLYLFLPTLGLISMKESDQLKPSSLIGVATEQTRWNCACPAPPEKPKLTGVQLILPEAENFSMEDLNEGGIGKLRGGKIKPEEQAGNLIGKLGRGLKLGLGGLAAGPILGMGKLINILPDGPASTSPSAFDRLEEWAAKNWKQLTDARQRELDKLMDMMDKNPDQALNYAIPLGGHEARRGRAAPSWQLGQRIQQLGKRQGGHAVDGWDMNYETQMRLEQQYRKAAGESEKKGDYERAAYIYGELLNDWSSAAQALIKAERHRDAVAIYLHKLNNKHKAAECLEEAGLIVQAVKLYVEIKSYEKAGDLYAQLDQKETAIVFWEKAVEVEKNPLNKAQLLFVKLEDLDRAISCLDESWRKGNRSSECIERQLAYLMEAHRNEEGLALINDVLDVELSELTDVTKVQLCLTLREAHREEEIQKATYEGALKIVSNQLITRPNSSTAAALLTRLQKFRQSDILLKRDTTRFIADHKTIKVASVEKRRGHCQPRHTMGIPQAGRWQSLSSIGESVSVAGCAGGLLTVAQVNGNGCHGSQLRTADYPGGNQNVHHIGIIGSRKKARVFHFQQGKKIHFRSLNLARTSDHDALGTIPNILAIGIVDKHSFMALCYTETGALITNYFNTDGTRAKTVTLDLAPPDIDQSSWLCAESDGHSCYSADQFAVWRYPRGQMASIQLNEPLHKLVMSMGEFPTAALISGKNDISVITPEKRERVPEFVNLFTSPDGIPPVACYANNGDILIACGSKGQIFTQSDLLHPVATFSFPATEGNTLDIAPAGARGFVILTKKGRLVVFD